MGISTISIGKVKFNWRGAWTTATAYTKDDVIRFGGKSYSCLISHTADADFYVDLTASRWSLMTDGTQWTSFWNTETEYKIGDLAKYGGNVYVANLGHTSGSTIPSFYTDIAKWDLYASSVVWEGPWQGTKFYKINDVISFGGNAYICIEQHTSGANSTAGWETNESKWNPFVLGQQFEDSYSGSTAYQKGDVVRYGGYLFIATNETTGNLPTDVTYWAVFSTGFSNEGEYSAVTAYKPGDLVRYGGLVYVALQDTIGNAPTITSFWELVVDGFNWAGAWSASVTYQKGNVVEHIGSSYVSLTSDNLNNIPGASASNWELMMQGSGDTVATTEGDTIYRNDTALTRLGIGTPGEVYKVNAAGVAPEWGSISGDKQFYVDSVSGVDSAGYGTQSSPWATIKYACGQITGPAVLFVKAGTYTELLPITVPAEVYVVGDGVRTTFVQPAVGDEEKTMWLVSNSCMLTRMTFQGLEGYVPATNPEDIENATIGGVYVALNPASPVTTKSPYVVECSCFSTDTGSGGAVGAIVDGSVHASGNRSILFHAYTCINDNGVGYWIKNGGKSEIVSCFTYFCHIGYASTGGGKIRALNGNNSYGVYGAVSAGFNSTEDTTNQVGTIYGAQLNYSDLTGGDFSAGNTITGATSGATATVTNVQASVSKVYYKLNTVTPFQNNETISNGSGVSAQITSSGLQNQQGFVLVVTGLGAEPTPGASVSIAGDTFSYVIQAVSGTFVDSSSVLILVLAQEKPSPGSADGTAVTVRYEYSQVRLTGHDFLSIGTGGKTTTNYPGFPTQPASQGNEVIENFPGRVYYVSTDQDGNFRVGAYFAVDQATGSATLNANAFNLSGLTSLRLGSIGAQLGELVNEFSSDSTLSGNSNTAIPTEQAVKTYFTKISSNVVPSITNFYTLGTPSILYNKLYVNSIVGPTTLIIDPAAEGDNTGTVQIKGNLQVDGTTTTINSTTLTVNDKNIVLGSGAANDAAADGSGITVESGDGNKTFNWIDATNAFTANQNIGVASTFGYLIDGTSVLNATTLGSGITTSSLTSVGTLTGLSSSGRIVASFTDGSTGSGNYQIDASPLTGGAFIRANRVADTNEVGISLATNGANSWLMYMPIASTNLQWYNGSSTVLTLTSAGNLNAAGTITSNSDARLKTNVETITSALDKVLALRGVMFDRISTGTREMGTIAQEVETIVPELVFTDADGLKSVAYANTVALLIEAIKELNREIQKLKNN